MCDHKACFTEVESQAISYTAGVPPAAAAILVAREIWNPQTMVNVEELDPDPFIEQLAVMGLPTKIRVTRPQKETAVRMPKKKTKAKMVKKAAPVKKKTASKRKTTTRTIKKNNTDN